MQMVMSKVPTPRIVVKVINEITMYNGRYLTRKKENNFLLISITLGSHLVIVNNLLFSVTWL